MPNGFNNPEQDKQALHQSTIANLQSLPQLAPEVLVPPVPGSEALPPVFSAQNFHSESGKSQKVRGHVPFHTPDRDQDGVDEDKINADQDAMSPKDYLRQGVNYEASKRLKEENSRLNFVTPSPVQNGEDEEVSYPNLLTEFSDRNGLLKLFLTK